MSTYIMAQLKVQVEEGSNAKRDGFTTTRGWYYKLMGG
jgi:hypothetical protein